MNLSALLRLYPTVPPHNKDRNLPLKSSLVRVVLVCVMDTIFAGSGFLPKVTFRFKRSSGTPPSPFAASRPPPALC